MTGNGDAKLPPHSIEAEQSVIGGLLLHNKAWTDVHDLIAAHDFFQDDHQRIFRHIKDLVAGNQVADEATVFESIKKSNETEQTGGQAYLRKIANAARAAASIRSNATIVREKSMLRSLISACDDIAIDAFNSDGRNIYAILDVAESRIVEIAEAGTRSRRPIATLADVLQQATDRISKLHERSSRDVVTGVATGYIDLDKLTSGLQGGELIVLAGRPGMGTTALALNIAEHVGVDLRLCSES